MRKTTLIIFLLIGSMAISQAQTLIPKVGISLSNLQTEDAPGGTEYNSSFKNGFTLGLACNIPVTAFGDIQFSLQPEFNYIQKGFNNTSSGEYQIGEQIFEFHADNKQRINYIEIPVLAKFEYGFNNIKVGVYAGPSLGFALSGKFKSESRVDTGEGIEVYKSEGKIIFYGTDKENTLSMDHNIDFGIQGGAVVTVFDRISLDVRYGQSLTNLYHDSKSKNEVLQFTVGVPLKL